MHFDLSLWKTSAVRDEQSCLAGADLALLPNSQSRYLTDTPVSSKIYV